MNDDKMINQDQPAAEAQTNEEHYSGGNAMLDAQIDLSNSSDEATGEKPIATNFSSNSEPNDAELYTTPGAYPPKEEDLEEDYTPPAIADTLDQPDPDIAAENDALSLEHG